MYEALSYLCMRPYATSVCGLKLLVYEALSCWCMRPEATSVSGLKLHVLHRSVNLGLKLAVAIALHNIPEGLGILNY